VIFVIVLSTAYAVSVLFPDVAPSGAGGKP
jgi:hypothetical protein